MDLHGFWEWLWQGLAWEVAVRLLALSGITEALGFAIAKYTFGWKPTRVQFWTALFAFPALLFVIMIAFVPPPPKPLLRATPLRGIDGSISMNGGPRYPFMVHDFSIANIGTMPTIVGNYGLKAVINGKDYYGQPIVSEDAWQQAQKEVAPTATPSDPTKDALFNITRRPLTPGDEVIGRLIYYFPQLSEGDLPVGTKFVLVFSDVFGHQYQAYWNSFPAPPGQPGGTFVLGMDPLVKPTPPPQTGAPSK